MKAARVVVLTVALAAGGIAALLAGRQKPAEVKQVDAQKLETVDVLVAKTNIPTGNTISPQDVQWQAWPASASSGNFIRKKNRPDAIEKMTGMIVRAPFVTGEPIREEKLVDAKGSGYMAAILPSGMRAISTQISPETGAGGFILPNDHVDVILTRRERNAAGTDAQTSETILSNVRVLAIDQTVQEKNGQKVVVGKTATLELAPSQAETLTLAQRMGSLSLALRSITDAHKETPVDTENGPPSSVNIIRFGVSTTSTVK
ncbi:MAG TPA: Flp pilus assembly protein CpaB [Gammaproteobacteria bacterium]|nr:Flp pilus assembly protein CpaB [Gammaproteobacteria bacterium]